ncbi:MAG: hypothetical protein AAF383_15930 [Cyanobacteria bacterium P01_A01_bin.83]
MSFTLDHIYTRQEIHEKLGGELETYLPQKNGKIVCGCFNLELNPQAPYIILVGQGDKIESKARQLSIQTKNIPIFIRKATNEWEYQGNFICCRYSIDQGEIDAVNRRSKREGVTSIIYLQKTSP